MVKYWNEGKIKILGIKTIADISFNCKEYITKFKHECSADKKKKSSAVLHGNRKSCSYYARFFNAFK